MGVVQQEKAKTNNYQVELCKELNLNMKKII